MKNLISFSVVMLLSLSGFAKPAASVTKSKVKPIELVISAQKDESVSVESAWIQKQPGVISIAPVFTETETKLLSSIGADYLAESLKIKLTTLISAKRLKMSLEQKYPSLDVEMNQMDILPQRDTLENKQWALKNKGAAQPLDLDQMIIYKVPGRVNEDIHVSNLVSKKEVVVAVLDTGVDKTHPDLQSNIVTKPSECKALEKFLQCVQDSANRKACEAKWFDPSKNDEVDQDKNGYPLDCQGWSLLGGINSAKIMGRPDFTDDLGHGTHVAGIISALSDNQLGVSSLSNKIKILPVQVLGDNPSEPIKPQSTNPANEEENQYPKRNLGDLVARGVIYAMANHAQVINFSLGWPQSQDSALMRKMIAEAQAQGIIVVAAAGNDSTSALLRPCGYQNVICVGAHGPDGAAAHFSNFGTGVDLLAPGTNILSTYPMSKRSIRFKEQNGYDYLSGTSQATPYVSAAAAYLLSLDIPAEEVYPRLVLGARTLQKPLKILVNRNQKEELQDLSKTYTKHFLSGNLDIQSAIAQKAQSLIVPSSKERNEVVWNLENEITFTFKLVNKWKDLKAENFNISATFQKQNEDMERPKITSVTYEPFEVWAQGEVREFTVVAQIENADTTRIPSDLNLISRVSFDGVVKDYIIEYDVVRKVGLNSIPTKSKFFNITGMPDEWFSIIPFDGEYARPSQMDYLGINYENDIVSMYLISQGNTLALSTAPYKASPVVQIEGLQNLERITEQFTLRLDVDGDGKKEYIVGLLTDNSEDGEMSPVHFYIFDQDFKLRPELSFVYNNKMAQMPRELFGMLFGKTYTPAWIGIGYDSQKIPDKLDKWVQAKNPERPRNRLYYLDAQHGLRFVNTPKNYILLTLVQDPRGLQLVFAKSNQGSNYLFDYFVATVENGELKDIQSIQTTGEYHNLLESREDKLWSLKPGNVNFYGQFWFSQAAYREIGLAVYDSKEKTLNQFDLSALREHTDAPLWVRSASLGKGKLNAFVFTNSELQFHDLKLNQIASRSLERFTFYVGSAFTNFHYPSVIRDQRTNQKIPALYTPEVTELSKGIKFIVPNYNAQGKLIELISPARLRMQSEEGCRSVDVPVVHSRATELDYICKDKIIRLPLEF